MNRFYVYGHFKVSDDSIFYVGMGQGDRSNCITGRHPHWNAVARKYGIYPVVLFESLTKQEAIDIEHELIKTLGRLDLGTGPLVNKTDGKEGVLNFVRDEQYRANVTAGLLRRYSREEEIEKTRQSTKKLWEDPEYRAKSELSRQISFNTPEIKENRKRITTERYKDESERKKTSDAMKAFYATPEGKAIRSKQMKEVWTKRREAKL
jgi:hypothetical protein